MLGIRKQYQKRGGHALSLPHLSPKWLQLSGLTSFPGNSLLPSQVTRTPANLLSKSHLYLQTVLPDPNLRRGRGRRGGEGREATDTEEVPLTCSPPTSRFLRALAKQKVVPEGTFSPRAPTGDHQHHPDPRTRRCSRQAGRRLSASRAHSTDETCADTLRDLAGLARLQLGVPVHGALTLMTLLRHSSATILTSDSASSLHSRKSSTAMPRSF